MQTEGPVSNCHIIRAQHCSHCGSSSLEKRGYNKDLPRFRCKSCGHFGQLEDPLKAKKYNEVRTLLQQGSSQRNVAIHTGLSRTTVAKIARKMAGKN